MILKNSPEKRIVPDRQAAAGQPSSKAYLKAYEAKIWSLINWLYTQIFWIESHRYLLQIHPSHY